MLLPGIEQEAGAGFNDRAQTQSLEQLAHDGDLPGQVGIVRVKSMVIEREGYAAVAQFAKNRQRVFQAVMGEPVGVITEAHYSHDNVRPKASHSRCRLYARIEHV